MRPHRLPAPLRAAPQCVAVALVSAVLFTSVAGSSVRPAPSASGRAAISAAPGYCPSGGGSTDFESITGVTLTRKPGNILRVKVDVFIANPTGCSAGNPCPEYDSSPEFVNVWIDWSGNGAWEPSEQVLDQAGTGYLNINYQGTMTFVQEVQIPPNAVAETWLRARR